MKIKLYDIKYETDGQKVKLPESLIVEVDNDFDIEQECADLISDITGFLVVDYRDEVIGGEL